MLEVGPELGNVRQRIVLERRDRVIPVAHAPVKLTVGEGAVWALVVPGEVTRIDPDTDNAKPFVEGVGASSSIAVDGTAVWLGGADGGVRKLSLRTGLELESTRVPPVLVSATTSIAVGRDAVWFVGNESARLWRIDPASASIVNSIALGTSPSAVAVGDDGAVWVASASAASLSRLDPGTNDVESIAVGATSGGLVADFEKIWTSPGADAG